MVTVTATEPYTDGLEQRRVLITAQYSEDGVPMGDPYKVDALASQVDTLEKAEAFLRELNTGLHAFHHPVTPDLSHLDGMAAGNGA
jgi:hypothetical protein